MSCKIMQERYTPTPWEFVVKFSNIYLGNKKNVTDEFVEAIQNNEDSDAAIKNFIGESEFSMFLFVIQQGASKVVYRSEPPNPEQIKKKCVLVIRSRSKKEVPDGPELTAENIRKEVVFMELNKEVLANLHGLCSGVYMPILGNPLNMIGWSDLVSQDLMDRFHVFLAHTYVTIGQIKGRTLLPLPANDITTSEKTSSKDKATLLENALNHWTKQIKNVLKLDPENALKNGIKSGKHPDPLVEINFWKDKSEDLNSISTQLSSERIKKVLKFLEQNKSTYTGPFSKLQKEVQIARYEANENYKYLQTLQELFDKLTDPTKELNDVADLFVPIMHTILLIWTYSEHYNTPARLVVIIREICNAIITACCGKINGEEIFDFIKSDSIKEAHNKLTLCIDVCYKFKDAYFDYKAQSKNQWKITTNALFVRLDAFLERCQDIQHFTSTIIQFGKIKNIEIGNTKGNTLTASVVTLLEEFTKYTDEFMQVKYDIMDIEKRQFDDDFYKFRQRIKELERRIASILAQGFDDSDTIAGKFKLLDAFEPLLSRPIIQDELEKKHITLLELFKQDLKIVGAIFMEGKGLVDKVDERAPISSNLPPITGALNWTTGLLERITEPMEKLDSLSQSIKDREEYKDVKKLYNSLCKNLKEYNEHKIKIWEAGVEENTEGKLNKFLLVREETPVAEEGFIRVNFDPILVRLLREVKYFLLLNIEVPEKASLLYQKVDTYRSQTGNLEIIANTYNGILSTLLPVEKPLLDVRIQKMNDAVKDGFDKLKWNSEGIDKFIKDAKVIVEEVDDLVSKMKENINKIQKLMANWEEPLFERKNRPSFPDDLQNAHEAAKMPKLEDIKNHGKEIHKAVKDTADHIKPNKTGAHWLDYQSYVNTLIIDGITNGIVKSMSYLTDQISIPYNKHHGLQPIFDIRVDLVDREVIFDPTIGCNRKGNGIKDILQSIVDDFISLAIQVVRVDTGQGDYLVEIKDQYVIYGAMQAFSRNFADIESATAEFINQYKDKEFLWKEKLQDSFQAFLQTGKDPREEPHYIENDDGEKEIDETFDWMAEKILEGIQTKKPALEVFDETITSLNRTRDDINALKHRVEIGWLSINASPLIKELQNTVDEWISCYTSFLLSNTIAEIKNIEAFIEDVSEGIKVIPKSADSKADKEILMRVMTHLRDVKMIKDRTHDEIEPMKQVIGLLKKHNVKMEEDFLVKLENNKTALADVSEKALGPVKEQILPLQNKEATNIKDRLRKFEIKVAEFRQEFQTNCPYNIQNTTPEIIDQAYQTISEYYIKTSEIEEEAKDLNNLETLFDMQKSTYKHLRDCSSELKQLKNMWDLIALIDYQFQSWKGTLWDKIDADNLTRLVGEMRTGQCNPQAPQNKEIKAWKSFNALGERVKNMNTILPLITELRSKFMMDRHWKKLMGFTQQTVDFKSPKFCFEDLIKLELHKFSEEVVELVEGATKEAKIETKLTNIQNTWETQAFEFKEWNENPILDSAALTEIVEFVETHSMELMGMMSSKDVEEFKEKVMHWQKNLKTVDSVIQIWMKTQRNWMRLQPIFCESEDIKAQLPDDSARFIKIDDQFREMMREAREEPGVITACLWEGREELLNNFYTEIELCEKALNEYLEQKKKIFARFYFVSNQALLDILSNGNNPEKVDDYIGDCFDGMKCLKFIRGPGIPYPSKRAEGMYSKEMEYVPFSAEFQMAGAVENYLCDLERCMQVNLRDQLEVAKQKAEFWEIGEGHKKRHEWLEDYCAQIALLATQVTWTEETVRAFDELDGGSETAMKEHANQIVGRIKDLITCVRRQLTPELRVKIITIITIDVHSRDVIEAFVANQIVDSQSFSWQNQLKFYMEYKNPKDDKRVSVVRICDWMTYYNYEYVGNCGRLVITPLTDRCYITLTQALQLSMGGAPAGPAGTGKTETTKDLGRALGLQVVVFNCSDQMNYLSMAQIFMGLSQSGSWGCFDEFNRISIDVLSVVAIQVKEVQDAIYLMKQNPAKNTFLFMDEEISLRLTVGFFITMNPGYAGRTELPENLKALFRSCAMVVPDIVLICENMLMSEGFATAKGLSKKFMCLYNLAKSLLSKQTHYDWGLRAVKSVLRQAGGLKRAEPDIDEEIILMRGLRDFNWPKIVVEDRQIFLGLINDLFPKIEAPQQINENLNIRLKQCAKEAGYQPDKDFILKCVQLSEIFDVRHSVFVVGNPGCAKSTIWKTLQMANNISPMDETKPDGPKKLTIEAIVDPKAVNSAELYGDMNPKTKEWKDGILAVVMRDMKNCQPPYKEEHMQKWIVLDGDVDPEWIETMNTVMDDNKVLTLVSQERIPLTPSMRLLLEISHLRNATPATVSRGGVLFVNDNDVGWTPFFDSWLAKYKSGKLQDELAYNVFQLAKTTYLTDSFIDDNKNKEHIAPVCEMGQVTSLTCIIDYLYKQLHSQKATHDMMKKYKEENKEEEIKNIYEAFFIFAGMWAYGASLNEDKLSFNGMWKGMAKVRFPEQGQCFDYFYDPLQSNWVHWDEKTAAFDKSFDGLFQNLVVPTAETARQKFLLDLHVNAKRGVLYVGSAGTGKTTIIKDYFTTLDKEQTLNASISFNNYTDSKALQEFLVSKVDKRAGRTFGPPPSKTLIYFMDDLNMPFLDKYGTQAPICLVRQIIDYSLLYDRDHLEDKIFLDDVMFTACQNPKSGSFNVDPRLTRHMTMISCLTAEKEILQTIYHQILDNHFCTFDKSCAELSDKIIKATMTVFLAVANVPQFMPTARKFHYQFNLRDFSKVVQNMNLAQPGHYKGQPQLLIRLWAHECFRVWHDRLIFEEDRELFMTYMNNALKEFQDLGKPEVVFEQPLLYTSYVSACEGHEAAYLPIKGMDHLKQVLEAKLEEYNESVASMNLVLFNQAMEHVSRIARIIDLPVGSALLVGVGGSGKQSLAKLSSFILGYDVFRIVVTTSYNMNDLKTDIQTMFTKTGVTGNQLLFILTDGQISDDKFLVYINDLLSAGWILDLFPQDELDGIIGKIRGEAKSNGYQDIPDELFSYFLDKVRRNLHLSLCFSPVGDAFRYRARMFPALINNTSIDWFHEWPEDALIDVSARFLNEVDFPSDEIREAVGRHMSYVHLSIGQANQEFLQAERRHNYTTPTSFLELINFYKLLLGQKQDKISDQISRLEIGLNTMDQTTNKVDDLKKLLEIKMVDVGVEIEKTNELIEVVGKESVIAEKESGDAAIQAEEVSKITEAAKEQKASADAELAEAIPAMERATEAVNCLEVKSIQELKALGSPPEACVVVAKAVLILKQGEKKNHGWPNAQKMMGNPKKFIDDIVAFDGDNIDEWKLTAIEPILKEPFFNFETMKGKSIAAAYLCGWIVNIVIYNQIFKKVKPLKEAAEAAQQLADEKTAELAVVMEKVRQINEKVDALKQQLQNAVDAKQKVEDEAQDLKDQLDLANRLVNGLADENTRWRNNVLTYKEEKITMIGDALVAAAFVSYIGPFNYKFRSYLWKEQWIVDSLERKIPQTEGIDPLTVLATTADQAVWQTQGLPADRVSLENASVVSSCNRYPLLIDPQLQGQKWIKGKEGSEMIIIQLSQKAWLKKVEMAVSNGNVLMIEALGQDIDPILDPLLSRQFVKKGKNFTVKLGSEDVELSPSFKLYLQTKLINPHYKPETAAQCTIINFIVTESGLEDQLLAMVVKVEKPDLEQQKEDLVTKQNEYMITLAELESSLLKSLSDADPATILQNTALIEQLETTKKTAQEISEQQQVAKETEVTINKLREVYRRVAAEGAMFYFLLIQLCIIDKMYQYSLESFTTFFFKAIEKTEPNEDDEVRVLNLREVIRMTIFQWVFRGLFVRHQRIFMCQLTFRLMQKKIIPCEYTEKEMQFLLQCPTKSDIPNPLKEWLPDPSWYSIQKLIELEGFEQFASHVEKEAPNRFKDWYNELAPEDEKLPLEWKKLDQMPFQKLLVIRVLRPDRMTTAMDNFIRKTLPKGNEFVDCDAGAQFFQILKSAYLDSTTTTPIYFILSPGFNPVITVEELCKDQGVDLKHLYKVSLGQGQDVNAMNKLDIAHKEGHWVLLMNVHLMPKFLRDLEKKLEEFAKEGSAPGFRLYLSSDPADSIPIGLLEKSIKLTSEPPNGVKQNMLRAFKFFSKETIEDKDSKVKSITFALCYFHTVMLERKKFGPKGWNMMYPFSTGDLRDSAAVMFKYMDTNASSGKVPWADLKYLIGEIMYGGHIVDDRDRIFTMAFLNNLMNDGLMDEAELFPFIEGKPITFKCPLPNTYEKYIEYIEQETPADTPLAFGMDPNAEIDFRKQQCIQLFGLLQEIQPRDASSGGGGGDSIQDKIKEFMTRVNDEASLDQNKLNIEDINSKISDEQRQPFQNTFLQECEYMNVLIRYIVTSLQEIELAFKGELTMTSKMEDLMQCIYLNKVPPLWAKYAFVSTRSLGSWLDNLKQRLDQLNLWKDDPVTTPKVTFLNRLFNPESFLTAIQQIFSREKEQELNKLTIQTDVLKKLYWEPDLPVCKEGAYVFGFQVEGARWDAAIGQLEESRPKKQFSVVPVVNCRAIPLNPNAKEDQSTYKCPCYKTENRGNTYVFTAQLKTKLPPQKWVLAGVALILDVEGVSDAFAPGKETPII